MQIRAPLKMDTGGFGNNFQFSRLVIDRMRFFGYSLYMEQEFNHFEEKLNHFVQLFQRLRIENNDLRQTVAVKTDDIKRLNEKLDTARARIAALIAQLPEAEGERL